MPLVTTNSMVDCLERAKILAPAQLIDIKSIPTKAGSPAQFVQTLVERGYLTSFQAKQVARGRGDDLVLGVYIILEPLGKGGTGQVFKARTGDRVVALKVLRPDLVKDAEAVQRFTREIEVAGRVCHPNIVQARDAGQAGSIYYLAMEYVDGRSLDQLVLKKGPLPPAQAAECIRQAALGLQHAFERGLVHRDIKPSNLLATQAGTVKILDLGLARLLEPPPGSQTASLTITSGAGVMQGTPDYMAPEQALDFHAADSRADIYSLGCTFYFLLAGRPPFAGGKTLAEKLMKHQLTAPALTGLNLPAGLDAVLHKMMAKQPADRYQAPLELVEALTPFCSSSGVKTADDCTADTKHSQSFTSPARRAPRRKRRPPLWLAGGGLLLLSVGVAGFFGRPAPPSATAPGEQPRLPSPNGLAAPKIGSFKERFQGPQPAPGWQYLWNAKGPIGNPSNYVPLVWTGRNYNADGGPMIPRPDPAAYLHLDRSGGHPGRGAKQAKGIDYGAIAAYTIQPVDGPASYRIANGTIGRGNNLQVIVHVNTQAPARVIDVPRRPDPTAFNLGLGALKVGDTIYVAVSPKTEDHQDAFDFDFTVMRDAPPATSVLVQEDFESAQLSWEQRGPAAFALDPHQPHGGKQSCRITVADNVPLKYQQVQRIIDDKPMADDSYQVQFWIRCQNVKADPGAYGYLEFLNSRGGRLGLVHSRVGVKNGAAGWELLKITAAAPADVARVRLGLVIQAAGSAWFDDVAVTRARRP